MGVISQVQGDLRCDFCGVKGARSFSCPFSHCDGVLLCMKCFPRRKRLIARSNHSECEMKARNKLHGMKFVEPIRPVETYEDNNMPTTLEAMGMSEENLLGIVKRDKN